MTPASVAIIGAGMAGLSCARVLADAGLRPVIFDKGRGVGGRLATRRTSDGLRFDHGAQYLTAKSAAFAEVLSAMRSAGAVAPWQDGSQREHLVGVPGMSGVAKYLAQGLDIRQGTELLGISRVDGRWWLQIAKTPQPFDAVVLTVPAPQVLRLLGPDHAFAPALSAVHMAPCLTLMAAFGPTAPAPFLTCRPADGPLSWIASDSSKPGREGQGTWVAQAGPDWSNQNLERDMPDIAHLMLPLLCSAVGVDIDQTQHSTAHRWRYARVITPLGAPFLQDSSKTLFAGGDWCIGARAEAAWTSGKAIAEDVLRQV